MEYNYSTHIFIDLQHLNIPSVLPILCVKRSIAYFENICIIKRKIRLGCQHSFLVKYSDVLNLKNLFTALWYEILATQVGILHVSDELRKNDLEVSELIEKKYLAFPSLKISRNPFLKWETIFAVVNGEFGAGTLNLAGSWNSVSQNHLLLFLWNSINIRPIFQPLENCGDLRVKVSKSSLLSEPALSSLRS